MEQQTTLKTALLEDESSFKGDAIFSVDAIELIEAPSTGGTLSIREHLAMNPTNSLEKNGANSTAGQSRRGGSPHSLLPSARVADVRIATSPEDDVRNVISGMDG